jgi:hypothetical protein
MEGNPDIQSPDMWGTESRACHKTPAGGEPTATGEQPLDAQRYGRNSFLVFESPYFTENAFERALRLCLKAGMTWMLFAFLEGDFEKLAVLYGEVADDGPDAEFARVVIGTGLKKEAGRTKVVFLANRGGAPAR